MADNLLRSELTELEKSLRILAANSSVSLNNLAHHPELEAAYARTKLGVSLLYDTPSYSVLTNMVSSLPKPNKIQPNTLGAVLFGCERTRNFCSPYCLDTILPPKHVAPITCCPHSVWLHDQGKLKQLNAVNSPTAQIYVLNRNARLSPEHVSTLKAAGTTAAEMRRL